MAESGGTSSLFRRATGGAAASVDNDRRALLDETPYEELGRDDGDTSPRRGGANLGTFMGVFSPVSVSMFSTLLFLRVGFIVGNLGLVGSFGALFLAYTLLLITVQSLCSIVTNGDVGGGGVYYMLSRCLGAEIGGTIGMVFYAANAVGSALYATGCAEGFIALFHMKPNSWEHYAIASLSNGFSLLICFVGAGAFGLASSGILVLILGVLGILVFNFSASSHPIFQPFNVTTVPHCHVNCTYHMVNGTFESLADLGWDGAVANLRDNSHSAAVYDCEDSAAYVSAKTAFAVLFSGVTGIMAGANLSGELRAPSKSIPYGTYSACAFTAAVYAVLFVFTAATCNRDLLYHECHYLGEIAHPSMVVSLGAVVTTFCAATSGLIGASQLLQAVAKDNLIPFFMASPLQRSIVAGRPILAYIATFAIVQGVLMVHSLNQIARLCTICYLLSYTFVNLACFLLDWSSAINFRPTMGAHWFPALLAVVLCVAAMAAVSLLYSLVGLFVTLFFGGCVIFGSRRGKNNDWGSVQQGILYHQVRKYLLMLDSRKYHVKFWRPQILLLVRDPSSSGAAIAVGNSLKKGGLFVIGHVFRGSSESLSPGGEKECPTLTASQQWLGLIDKLGVKAFADFTVASTLREGVQHLVRLSGLGAMRPNIVMIGFRKSVEDKKEEEDNTTASSSEVLHSTPRKKMRLAGPETGARSKLFSVQESGKKNKDKDDDEKEKEKESDTSKHSLPDLVSDREDNTQDQEKEEEDVVRDPEAIERAEGGDGDADPPAVGDQPAAESSSSSSLLWNRDGFPEVDNVEFCNIIRDVGRLGKSLVIHRGVRELDEQSYMRRFLLGCRAPRKGKTVDVWMVDFLSPPNSVVDDLSCMLSLQLAFIASNKHGGLPARVLLRSCGDPNLDEDIVKKLKEIIVKQRLKKLVKAIEVLEFNIPIDPHSVPTPTGPWGLDVMSVDQMRLVNHRVRDARGDKGVLSLFYLGEPPEEGQGERATKYLRLLEALTENVGPCLLIKAEESVSTTEL